MGKIGIDNGPTTFQENLRCVCVCARSSVQLGHYLKQIILGEKQMLVVLGLEDPESRKGALVHPSEASAFSHVAHFKFSSVTCLVDPGAIQMYAYA